jgi:hypothetical protein
VDNAEVEIVTGAFRVEEERARTAARDGQAFEARRPIGGARTFGAST